MALCRDTPTGRQAHVDSSVKSPSLDLLRYLTGSVSQAGHFRVALAMFRRSNIASTLLCSACGLDCPDQNRTRDSSRASSGSTIQLSCGSRLPNRSWYGSDLARTGGPNSKTPAVDPCRLATKPYLDVMDASNRGLCRYMAFWSWRKPTARPAESTSVGTCLVLARSGLFRARALLCCFSDHQQRLRIYEFRPHVCAVCLRRSGGYGGQHPCKRVVALLTV